MALDGSATLLLHAPCNFPCALNGLQSVVCILCFTHSSFHALPPASQLRPGLDIGPALAVPLPPAARRVLATIRLLVTTLPRLAVLSTTHCPPHIVHHTLCVSQLLILLASLPLPPSCLCLLFAVCTTLTALLPIYNLFFIIYTPLLDWTLWSVVCGLWSVVCSRRPGMHSPTPI